MDESETVTGATLLADALKNQGVQWVFGVVGIPVTNIAPALQDAGIGYIGMRNEQAVSTNDTSFRFALHYIIRSCIYIPSSSVLLIDLRAV